ncbi:MAG: lipopolysaccharide biosynthesis protein RfbH [Myxococcales bacterium]
MNRDEAKALEKQLTAEILERVQRIAELRRDDEKEFLPGRSAVRYAGRVYDGSELTNLVESSLEFWLTAGRWHRRFETDLAKWYGLPFARAVNSGSSANLLAAAALTSHTWGAKRLRPGDEVITVAAGFPTTVAPLIQQGAVPVFVDVSLPTYNIDVSMLEAARTERTRAVMVAHTLGNPFDLDAVTAFCRKHDLWLVEDNCDASGSLYRGQKTGTFGDLATLSFYPPHHMTMGEGGAVLGRTEDMRRVVESFRDWGRDCWCNPGVDNTCGKRFGWKLGELPQGYDHKYVYSHLGYNLKITDMQAAIGVAQLAKLESFGAARRANWRFYREAFADLGEYFVLPEPTEGADPSWFGFMLTVKPGAPFTREEVVRHLEARKVQTRMLFAGNLLRQPAMTELKRMAEVDGRPAPYRVVGELRNTDRIMTTTFWFGVYPGLTEAMRQYVVDELRRFVQTAREGATR